MKNDSSSFKIRPASSSDAAAISQLIIPIAKEFVSREYSSEGEARMLDSMSEASIRNYMAQSIEYLVAVVDGKIAGALAIKEQNHIFHLFVNKKSHRQGIAKALWQDWLEKRINLSGEASDFTVNSSKFAVDFYRELGFIASPCLFEKNGITCYPMTLHRHNNG